MQQLRLNFGKRSNRRIPMLGRGGDADQSAQVRAAEIVLAREAEYGVFSADLARRTLQRILGRMPASKQ